MAHKDNTLSVSPGNIVLNGCRVSCVTDFKYECIGSHMANVTIAFDIPVQKVHITNQNTTEEIRIPIQIGDTLVDEIVIPQEDDRVSRKELLELALYGIEQKVFRWKTNTKASALEDEALKELKELLNKRDKIIEELHSLTNKEV